LPYTSSVNCSILMSRDPSCVANTPVTTGRLSSSFVREDWREGRCAPAGRGVDRATEVAGGGGRERERARERERGRERERKRAREKASERESERERKRAREKASESERVNRTEA
jgi:hypothetical protein